MWVDQLPPGYSGRILQGARIDPRTLEAEAGFYGHHDPERCPSQLLRTQLALRGDSLILRSHRLVPLPTR